MKIRDIIPQELFTENNHHNNSGSLPNSGIHGDDHEFPIDHAEIDKRYNPEVNQYKANAQRISSSNNKVWSPKLQAKKNQQRRSIGGEKPE